MVVKFVDCMTRGRIILCNKFPFSVDQPAHSVAPLSFSMNSLEGCTDKVFDFSTGSTLAESTTNSLNRRPKYVFVEKF